MNYSEPAYICLNGDFVKSSQPCIFANNRGFRYNDSLVENIHAYATEPQFLPFHMERLCHNMQYLFMEIPAFFTESTIHKLIIQLLNKNRIFSGAGVRLTVYRSSGEEAVPVKNSVSFMLECYSLSAGKYNLNEKGLNVDICKGFTKLTGPLAHLRNANIQLYIMAGIESRNKNVDTVILLNETDILSETINSNIFLVSGKSIFTPGLRQGCIPGIMRRVIISIAEHAGYRMNDQSNLTTAALPDAEEIFLTNAIEGIRWVGAFEQQRYFNRTAKFLSGELNKLAFNII